MSVAPAMPCCGRLSIVVPCYNEASTLRACLERLLGLTREGYLLEIIVVDDASTDRSLEIARELALHHPEVRVLAHDINQGKGAALTTGIRHASGDVVAIQDADLEYHPQDLKRVVAPILSGDADVVLGTRFTTIGPHRVLYFWHYVGNRFLTLLSNMFTDLNITDMECGYKAFRRDVIQSIDLEEQRFGIEPELVAKMARMRLRIYEVGVSYAGRTYAEGKKIGVRDGFRALYCILHYNGPGAPSLVQLPFFIGILSATATLEILLLRLMRWADMGDLAAMGAGLGAAVSAAYWICSRLLFRRGARWGAVIELALFAGIMAASAVAEAYLNPVASGIGLPPSIVRVLTWVAAFVAIKRIVFSARKSGPWAPLKSGLNADTSLAMRICHPNGAAPNMNDQGPASALRHAAPRQELPGDTHG